MGGVLCVMRQVVSWAGVYGEDVGVEDGEWWACGVI